MALGAHNVLWGRGLMALRFKISTHSFYEYLFHKSFANCSLDFEFAFKNIFKKTCDPYTYMT